MSQNQQKLADFGSNGQQTLSGIDRGEWPYFCEYGATMDKDVPYPDNLFEWRHGASMDLEGTGLAPGDFGLLAAKSTPTVAVRRGYHPDDEHRPSRLEQTEAMHRQAEEEVR